MDKSGIAVSVIYDVSTNTVRDPTANSGMPPELHECFRKPGSEVVRTPFENVRT